MESVTLIAKAGDLLPVFKRRIQEYLPESQITNQGGLADFMVQSQGADRLYFAYEGSTLDTIIGWSKTEISQILEYFPMGLHVYSIHYRCIETIKKALIVLANSNQILVDNDFGTLLPGSDFVQKIQAEAKWNWWNDLNSGIA